MQKKSRAISGALRGIFTIELNVNHGIENFNENCSLGSNPLRLPHSKRSENIAPPLLRGGWEGFRSVMVFENINNKLQSGTARHTVCI